MPRTLSKSAKVTALCAVAALFAVDYPVSAQESIQASSAVTIPTSTRSLPIFYDRALSAQGFPNPLVKARIDGHEATFIIDSGASTNVLADWYVKVLGAPTSATDSRAVRSSGNTTTERLLHGLQGHWSDGQRFALNEAVAIAFPPYFHSLHIGGAVSPQLLAPAGMAAVLDLRIPSLRFVPFARALSDLRRSKVMAATPPEMRPSCRNVNSKLVNRVYLTPVTAAGVSDLMLVDTGATRTMFSDESKIAHAIESGSAHPGHSAEGAGGKVGESRIVRNVRLLRGGRIVTVSRPSIGKLSSPCGAKGILGMDALHSCVLVLGDKNMAFSCS